MRRDASGIVQNESFGITLDTFGDKRNGLLFMSSSLGGLRDSAVTDESSNNIEWNTVWDARTARFENGWIAEFVIPFKSLRYNPGSDQQWGIQVRREVRWKNETSFLTLVPRVSGQYRDVGGFARRHDRGSRGPGQRQERRDQAVRHHGPPHRSGRDPVICQRGRRRCRLRREVWSLEESDARPDLQHRFRAGRRRPPAGQPDAVQPLLPRAPRLLSGRSGHFRIRRGWGSAGGGGISVTNNTPVLFFSRRIGLNNGRPVPIRGGGRITGKAGAYSIGVLNIQSNEEVAADARPDEFLRGANQARSLPTEQHRRALHAARRDARRQGSGRDVRDRCLVLRVAQREPQWVCRPDSHAWRRARRGQLPWATSTTTPTAMARSSNICTSERGFNPEVGFLRRTDFTRQYAEARFSPRPARTHWTAVRRFVYLGSFEYFEDGAGTPEMREAQGSFSVQLQSGDYLTLRYLNDYELIPRPFPIAPGVVVPVGGYDYQSGWCPTCWSAAQDRRPVSFRKARSTTGRSGTSACPARGSCCRPIPDRAERFRQLGQLAMGTFTSTVVTRAPPTWSSPRMFMSVLIQYNSSLSTLGTNAGSVGSTTRQRAVRRLQRRPRHGAEGVSRARESRVRHQDQSAVSILDPDKIGHENTKARNNVNHEDTKRTNTGTSHENMRQHL